MEVIFDALIPYIVPGIILIAGYLYNHFKVHIPDEVRKYARLFTDAAAAYVEQKYGDKSNEEKMAIALETAKGFFRIFKLPAPSDAILIKLIEAAVNALSKPEDTPPLETNDAVLNKLIRLVEANEAKKPKL